MKSNYKEIGFGKQTIAKVFEEWYTVPRIRGIMSGKVIMFVICWKTLSLTT
ncbi:hypothetical protein [Phocaeicola coprocola]